MWLTRARESQLTDVAHCALVITARALRVDYGFPEQVVAEPSADQLVLMLEVLDPEFARCVVHGLLHPQFRDMPAAALATRRPEAYFRAADSEPPSGARDVGPSLRVPAPPTEPDKKAEAATMTPPEQQDSRTSDDGKLRDLRDSADRLRSHGDELARALRETAQLMSEGRVFPADGWTSDAVDGWRRRRTLLAESVSGAGGTWDVDSGFAQLEAEFDRLEAVESEERRRRLEDLRQREAQLKTLIAVSDASVAAHLEQALNQLAVQIADLESGPGEAAVPSAESEEEVDLSPATELDAAVDAAAPAPQPSVVVGQDVLDAEPVESTRDEAATVAPQPSHSDGVTEAGETTQPVEAVQTAAAAEAPAPPVVSAPR
ncbi:hypothetical protein [Streptomyces sp. NBC_00076]|uniref:hypothetical protein n=1 Tax=Streptomyces sp. NBC_00076 TaxID=2975642 RepID=UPI0032537351